MHWRSGTRLSAHIVLRPASSQEGTSGRDGRSPRRCADEALYWARAAGDEWGIAMAAKHDALVSANAT